MKRIIYISASILAAALALTSCNKEAEVKVEFKEAAYSLKVGDTLPLAGELVISNSEAKPAWTLSDDAVASVDADGLLTALKNGETTVTAVVEGKEASCTVTVSDIEADKIILTAPESLEAGAGWGEVKAQVEPSSYDMDNLEWEFTPDKTGLEYETEKVSASVYKVRFTSFVEGASLSVKVSDANSDVSQTAVIAVSEKVIPAESLSLEMPSEITEGEDGWESVKVTVRPEGYDTEHLVWEFEPSDPGLGFKYEKVSAVEYKVRFDAYLPDGFVNVTVTDEISKTFTTGRIKVLEKQPEVVYFEIKLVLDDEAAIGLPSGAGTDIIWNCSDENGDPYQPASMTWTSSDPAIATVDDKGHVTVVGKELDDKGTEVTVTLKADNMEASIVILAVRAWPESLTVTDAPVTMTVGETYNLVATISPEDASQDVAWTPVSGPEVPRLGDLFNGIFTPVAPGTYVLKAFSHYVYEYLVGTLSGSKSFDHIWQTVTVEVVPVPIENAYLSRTSLDMEIGETTEIYVTFEPDDNKYLDRTIVWASSDESVATVSGGDVTAVSSGTATVTATLSDGRVLECEVTVKENVTEVNIGDYFYADGTYSSEYKDDSSNPVVGIVFAKTNATNTDDVLSADHPGCTHGLVVSLDESSEGINWQNPSANVAAWAAEQEAGYVPLTSESLYCGYSNTKAIRAYNEANPDSRVLVADGCPADAPEGTSGWYVPSYAELLLLKDSFSVVSANIGTAGGVVPETKWTFNVRAYYWSSTENDGVTIWAAAVHFLQGGQTNMDKTNKKYKVRYILAF